MVGVGASAGGLEAFGRLLTRLPEDTGMVLTSFFTCSLRAMRSSG